MELIEALDRIDAIRAHVARTRVFRGYKAATVGCTGLLAFLAAALQPHLVPDPLENMRQYLQLWIGVAVLSVICVAIELGTRCWDSDSPFQRALTVQAVEHFIPCLVAGACVTWAVVQFSPNAANLLPGLWAIMFSLGVFASCRQLPPLAIVVAIYYLVAGVTCLAMARGIHALSPWTMAGTFGVGQLLTASVLYLALERTDAKC
ncbi:MAG TPA: hypothetical protein VIY86_09885 [Pirellulaceae bacterium]